MSVVPGLVASAPPDAEFAVTCWACGAEVAYAKQAAHTCWGADHPVMKRLAAIEARLPKSSGDA